MTDLAPDRVGVEVGYRAWRVQEIGGQLLLASISRPDVWHPRSVVEAACDRSAHAAPRAGCSCGVYAAHSLAQLLDMRYADFADHDSVVTGEVSLWGTVVAATQGWRGQWAYPRRLFVPYERWRCVAPLRSTYGVPVVLANTLNKEGR